MRGLVASALTLVLIVAYGALLTWLLTSGYYWLFVGCIALSAAGTYWMASPAERGDFAADIRNIIERCRR